MRERLDCEYLVVGSGPAGATTACLLAEAGRDVLLVEEGGDFRQNSAISYTLDEIDQKYRNGGLTTTLGGPGVTYIEGRCVGGGSEVNAAFYVRPSAEVLAGWQDAFSIEDFGSAALETCFDDAERELSVSTRPEGMISPQAKILVDGAAALGWSTTEVARCWKYSRDDAGRIEGQRQTMSVTMLPRAIATGCRLLSDTKLIRIAAQGRRAGSALCDRRGRKLSIGFDRVVLCAGAIQSPLILRRSGFKARVGDSLQMHPMIRMAARFDRVVNDPVWGVPVHQVDEFKPKITLGCSHSSLPHLAMWLGRGAANGSSLEDDWPQHAVFYIAAATQAKGKIRNVPVVDEPLVRYRLSPSDVDLLAQGLDRLGQALFAAGAEAVFSPVPDTGPILGSDSLSQHCRSMSADDLGLSALHLFGACPMGEDRERCAVDSWGRLHAADNVHVHDASILPASPGCNPQGTIMALARRNTAKLLAG